MTRASFWYLDEPCGVTRPTKIETSSGWGMPWRLELFTLCNVNLTISCASVTDTQDIYFPYFFLLCHHIDVVSLVTPLRELGTTHAMTTPLISVSVRVTCHNFLFGSLTITPFPSLPWLCYSDYNIAYCTQSVILA